MSDRVHGIDGGGPGGGVGRDEERLLLRLLSGELAPGEERALRRRLAEEPELARAHARLEHLWDGLGPPPGGDTEGVPPGFTGRVMARVRSEASGRRLPVTAAPPWVRAAGAAALVAGLVLGGLGGAAAVLPQAGARVAEGGAPTASLPAGTDSEPESLSTDLAALLGDETAGDDGDAAGSLAEGYAAALAAVGGGEEGT